MRKNLTEDRLIMNVPFMALYDVIKIAALLILSFVAREMTR